MILSNGNNGVVRIPLISIPIHCTHSFIDRRNCMVQYGMLIRLENKCSIVYELLQVSLACVKLSFEAV